MGCEAFGGKALVESLWWQDSEGWESFARRLWQDGKLVPGRRWRQGFGGKVLVMSLWWEQCGGNVLRAGRAWSLRAAVNIFTAVASISLSIHLPEEMLDGPVNTDGNAASPQLIMNVRA